MEDKLVTVAIHTYEKAQILKHLLDNEGIETYIHNINLIQPVVSAGVRVRIKESDLPKALAIIEALNIYLTDQISPNPDKENRILIPVDFSEYSHKACLLAFRLASHLEEAEITILHTYFTGLYSSIPLGNTFVYETTDEENLVKIVQKANADIEELAHELKAKIKKGEIPKIKFNTILKEGVPEEEIIKFSKEYDPNLIIMGTRVKTVKKWI